MKSRIAILICLALFLVACDGRTGDVIRSIAGDPPTAPTRDSVVIAYSADVSCTTLTVRDETISSGMYERLHVTVLRHDSGAVVLTFDVDRGRDRSVNLDLFVTLNAPERFRLEVVALDSTDDPVSRASSSAPFFVPQSCG